MDLKLLLLVIGVALANPADEPSKRQQIAQLPAVDNGLNQVPDFSHFLNQIQNSNWWQLLENIFKPGTGSGGNSGSSPDTGDGGNNAQSGSSSVQCGASSLASPDIAHHIVGGQQAQSGMFPWQVIVSTSAGPSNGFFCGGSYVVCSGDKVCVLTAAHCVSDWKKRPYEIQLTFDALDRTKVDSSHTVVATDVKVHRRYNSRTMVNDVAVIKTGISVSDFRTQVPGASPICLASQEHLGGEKGRVAGFGTTSEGGSVTNKLMYVEKDLMTNEACRKTNNGNEVTDDMLCAGEKGIDACQGDSGGCLAVYRNGQWEQVGVVSWGYGCGRENYPGVYANVHYLLNKDWWLLANL